MVSGTGASQHSTGASQHGTGASQWQQFLALVLPNMSFPHHLSAVVAGNNDGGSGAAELEVELHVVQHHRLCSEYSVAKGTPELSVDIGAHVLDENLSNGVLFDRFFYLELAADAKLGQYGWEVF